MNHTIASLLVLSIALGSACDGPERHEPELDAIEHPQPTFRTTPAACGELTLARYDELVATIEQAIELAETDVDNHGETGAYWPAPGYALSGLEDAHDEATSYRDYFAANPVLYPGVAYNLRFRRVQESMWYVGHWANVSAVYHASEEARQYHALTEDIVAQADSLRADAGRCYMDWAFGDASP